MYPRGFTGLIECRLLNIFEPGVCPVWIMCYIIMKLINKFDMYVLVLVSNKTLDGIYLSLNMYTKMY